MNVVVDIKLTTYMMLMANRAPHDARSLYTYQKEQNMAEYTELANQFIDSLVKQGIDKNDIFTHFITKGKQVIWPVIGQDGKPHLEKKTFK